MLNLQQNNTPPLQFVFDDTGVTLVNRQQNEMTIQEFGGTAEVALKALAAFLKQNKLHRLKAELILTPQYYRLLLVDAPALPKEEYKLAARWLIKDFIDYPPEQAAIDAFPITVKPGQVEKMYVVASPLAPLIELVAQTKKAGILLEKINITELVFATKLHGDSTVQALLYRVAERLRLLIIANQEVSWLRDLDVEWNPQQATQPELEHLGTELQRSLDYYQTEVSTIIPQQLELAPEIYGQDNIVTYLGQLTAMPIVPLITESHVTSLRQLVAYYLIAAT